MKRSSAYRRERQRVLIWILSGLVVLSMVCGYAFSFSMPKPAPQPTLPAPTVTPSPTPTVTPTPSAG